MSRDYKNLVSGEYYHVYNRGHGYRNVFHDDQDYRNYIKRLSILLGFELGPRRHAKGNLRLTPVPAGSFDILSYCLMPNHFHILIKQNADTKISVLMNRLGTSYGKYFNTKYSLVGSVFQDTFKAKLVENDPYLSYLTAYIHNNPGDLNYPYSSFGEYIHNTKGICNKDLILRMFNNDPLRYKNFVIQSKKVALTMFGDKGDEGYL
jgi:putative transposase